MTRKEILSLLILILVLSYGAYKYITREYNDTHSRYLLDTIVEISAGSNNKNVTTHIFSIFDYIEGFENKFNEFDSRSLISKINHSEEEEFAMDEDLYAMLVIADSLYQVTDGAFDITIKPVWDLWDFNSENPIPPDPKLLKSALDMVGFDKIYFDKEKLIKPRGMQLSLGAIAKGYIFDKASALMQEKGLSHGFINSRSSITFFGDQVHPLVYITHPRNVDATIASFRLDNRSVGTSGDYQQYFEHEGTRYHHIIDAHTGYPVEDIFSVTVIHPSAAWADGLSTALFLMPPDAAMEYITSLKDTNCVIYYLQDDAIVSLKSSGMKDLEFSENL
ncbi:MAG: FAD:protein FMN transferase [Candidatus Cloacimonetes bacterium]|jgi:thiamine biosynthesis lipoprotein|nr:FAD:protein FMN transferase [Candidatus Cloacimonadota bacterium]MDY0336275.1 FAD:protein FMN transferase [Candidatus Cloacimonadaceae bacterium]MDD2542822.1 FAD:protein FMN transferase [Candidatus Cloacimonadota bacterium]MDD2683679.1 FAD:protein FMN transferase [Candidatus Cloacimonadota bacterium]MDD3096102.1 FAD:protein FMN transferase [Candidatus Cloacimonadota bacterium]